MRAKINEHEMFKIMSMTNESNGHKNNKRLMVKMMTDELLNLMGMKNFAMANELVN